MPREPALTSTIAIGAVGDGGGPDRRRREAIAASPRAARGLPTRYARRGQQIRRAAALVADDAAVPYADQQNLPATGTKEAS